MLKSDLNKGVEILKKGGIVVYPTDTAFGIGCRIDDVKAVERLFKIRRRPITQAVPVLVNSIKMAKKYLLSPLPINVRHLMDRYWPGALTIIYPCRQDLVPSLVRGKGKNLGVRMPNHEVPLKLISAVGVPILGPSANFHGQMTPYKYGELDPKLLELADYVIPGKCQIGQTSTVIDCSKHPWKILRQGAVEIKKAVLYIDTSDNRKTSVFLEIDGKEKKSIKKTDKWTSQVLLPMIDKLLKENNLSVSDVSEIKVNTGPGSFTGIRVGLTVANTLGYLLDIPVNGRKNHILEPNY